MIPGAEEEAPGLVAAAAREGNPLPPRKRGTPPGGEAPPHPEMGVYAPPVAGDAAGWEEAAKRGADGRGEDKPVSSGLAGTYKSASVAGGGGASNGIEIFGVSGVLNASSGSSFSELMGN